MATTARVAGTLLALALSACSTPARTEPAKAAPPQASPVKEVCHRDDDCAPFFRCTSDRHCRCQLDGDCAATQRCRAGLCLPR